MRNKIAGFTTHLMRRLQKGTVRGISLKVQEEERERKLDFVPDVSRIQPQNITLDAVSFEMAEEMDISMDGLVYIAPEEFS
mmetsp:Transcript_21865/g.3631  ORF Transcript_21865/g.3631 Transcript_21865/m.3631 type:complete len:81 (+) Transcript_21865:135-377(+)